MSKGWTWAHNLIGFYEKSTRCDVCGRGNLFPDYYPEYPLSVEVEGGTQYPDILGCGAYPLFIVSENVIKDWEVRAIRGYEKFALSVVKATGKKIKDIVPPSYYHIKVTGRCNLDLEAMGLEIIQHCPKCLYTRADPMVHDRYIIDAKSWDGTSLFISELFPSKICCTQDVLDLASVNKRTNFRFTSF